MSWVVFCFVWKACRRCSVRLQYALGAKSYRVLCSTILSQQFSTLLYIMGHLSSCTALLCCNRFVKYSTLRFWAHSLVSVLWHNALRIPCILHLYLCKTRIWWNLSHYFVIGNYNNIMSHYSCNKCMVMVIMWVCKSIISWLQLCMAFLYIYNS